MFSSEPQPAVFRAAANLQTKCDVNKASSKTSMRVFQNHAAFLGIEDHDMLGRIFSKFWMDSDGPFA